MATHKECTCRVEWDGPTLADHAPDCPWYEEDRSDSERISELEERLRIAEDRIRGSVVQGSTKRLQHGQERDDMAESNLERRAALLARLRELANADADDFEAAHADADHALIEFIGDPEIAAAYLNVPKWYA